MLNTQPLVNVDAAGWIAHTLELMRRADTRLRQPASRFPNGGQQRGRADPAVLCDIAIIVAGVRPKTVAHARRTAILARQIVRALALPEPMVAIVSLAALLHDIGKAHIPAAILDKPGPLSAAEWAEVKRHPDIGDQMLRNIPGLEAVLPIVRHHHERYDGAGYPAGLAGEAIPLGARILAVPNAFDAMRSQRPYQRALSLDEAVEELRRHAGQQFDPVVVDVFLKQVLSPDQSRSIRTTPSVLKGPKG